MAATETNDLVQARDPHREAPRRSLAIAAIVAALLLAGCGSSAPSTTSLVKKNWAEFFAGSTPASKRVKLLQNGAQFAHVLQQQTGSSYTKDVSVTVSKVQVTSSTSASVHYNLYLNGQDVLPDQQGTAIKQSGTWKVSASSFCSLLALESVDAPGCPRS